MTFSAGDLNRFTQSVYTKQIEFFFGLSFFLATISRLHDSIFIVTSLQIQAGLTEVCSMMARNKNTFSKEWKWTTALD